ncbi:MAG: hypothetical protein WC465_04715 [Patescibacteria group bacterium]
MPILQHHKLFRHDSLNGRELSTNYLSDQNECGQLFIILEVPKNKIDQQPLLDELVNRAANHFASTNNPDPETVLEEILRQLNQSLPELSSLSRLRNWLYTLDMAVGIFYQDQVFISTIGNINAWLITKAQYLPITKKNTSFNPAKAFADVVSGRLEEGDALIVSTNSLFDYIAKEKIKQLIRRYTPMSATNKIGSLLETVPDFVTFNSLFIKNPSSTDIELRPEQMRLSPEGSEVGAESGNIVSSPADIMGQTHTKTVLDLGVIKRNRWFRGGKNFFSLIAIFFKSIWQMLAWIYRQIKNTVLFIFSGRFRQEKEDQAINTVKSKIDERYNWWQRLNLAKKIALVGLVITVLIFMQSLVILTQKKSLDKKSQVYQELIQTINAKFAEAESKMIYNDQMAAESLILEIENSLQNLNVSSPRQQAEIDAIKDKVAHQLNTIRRIHEVPEPVELASLANLASPRQIAQKQGQFYILDQQKLYQVKNQSVEPMADFNEGKLLADWPNKPNLILGNNEKYFIFNIQNKTMDAFAFAKSAGNNSVQDLNIYSDNLYVLDTQANQFFKYPGVNNSFTNGQKWLKGDSDVRDVNSFAIDGSIYSIDNQGIIKKFTKGAEEKFTYQMPRPQIGKGATIQTFRDSKFLYIIDPQNKRVIILNKDGNIKDQYTSPKFDNLLDLTIDPAEKAIYLLNGQHLYLLAINQ